MNAGTTLLSFGRDQHKSDNSDNNVYRSFQLDNGNYKLSFHSEGEAGKTMTVKIQKLSGKRNVVLNSTASVGGDAAFAFKIEDGWGEYKFTLTRENAADEITITKLMLTTATDEEVSALSAPQATRGGQEQSYTLSGIPTAYPQRGLNVVRAGDEAKKVWVR
jgi:hypothetical protein